jgi:hypothetical protein
MISFPYFHHFPYSNCQCILRLLKKSNLSQNPQLPPPLPMKDGLCSILEKKLDPVPVSVQTVSVAQKVVISRRKSKLSGMMGTKGHCETATAILTTPATSHRLETNRLGVCEKR